LNRQREFRAHRNTNHLFGGLLAVAALAIPNARALADEAAEVFAPGVVSAAGSNFAPTFSPSSSFVLFSRKSNGGISILLSKRNGSEWSEPIVAPFSGRWSDLETAISVDGSYVIFASDRPIPGAYEPLRLNSAGVNQTGGNLWRVKIIGREWGEPEWLPALINKSSSTWTPSIAGNGNLYFMSADEKTGRFRLHLAPMYRGVYTSTSDIVFSTGEFNDVDPMIDPKERFLIFSSDRSRPGTGISPGPERLFIAFNPRSRNPVVCPMTIPGWEDTSLSQVEARLNKAGTTLYFASNHAVHKPTEASAGSRDDGNTKIWMIPFNAHLWGSSSAGHSVCNRKPSPVPRTFHDTSIGKQ
jgi:WD40-like Beta Propeller Repeat